MFVYQSSHVAGLSGQRDYTLHAVCWEDTIQSIRFRKVTGRILQGITIKEGVSKLHFNKHELIN